MVKRLKLRKPIYKAAILALGQQKWVKYPYIIFINYIVGGKRIPTGFRSHCSWHEPGNPTETTGHRLELRKHTHSVIENSHLIAINNVFH